MKTITSSRRRVNDEKSCQQDFKEFYYKAADQNNDNQLGVKNGGIIDTNNNNKGLESWSSACITSLTVWRKSLLMSCSGFTVIDSKGNLVYRVDNYRGRPGEIVLMDASGTSVLTIRRQKVRNYSFLFLYFNHSLILYTIYKKLTIRYISIIILTYNFSLSIIFYLLILFYFFIILLIDY